MRGSLAKALLQASSRFDPPKFFSTHDWLSENYYLPSEAGFDGLYQFLYAPYFIGVANVLDDPKYQELVLMKASQIGWTYFVLGYIFKRVKTNPCPILGVFAREKDAKSFHDEKLLKAVPANPLISELMDVTSSNKSGNRWDHKSFPGGFLKLVGSNSPGNLKSTSSVGVAFVEEPDDTADDVGKQGDAIGLSEERLKRYPGNKKLIIGGTPKTKDLSKTEKRLKTSDARVLPIVCHSCEGSHVLDWDNVYWDGKDEKTLDIDKATGEILGDEHEIFGFSNPESASYVCPHCETHWDDYQRKKNIKSTVFDAVARGELDAGWEKTQQSKTVAGFQRLSELYVCIPGIGLSMLVREYLNAAHLLRHGDKSAIVKFTNQKLGLAYEYEGDNVSADELREKSLGKNWPENTVPRGGLVVTVGIDVQHDRVAIVKRAWGRGEQSWLVYWGEIPASNTCIDEDDQVWANLEAIVFQPLEHELGGKLHVSAVSIDSSDGVTSGAVYNFVRSVKDKYSGTLVMAIKGASNDNGKEIYNAANTKTEHKNEDKKPKHVKYGVNVFTVGTNKAKDWLSGKMKLTGIGSGRFHIPESVRPDYFDQVTAEVKAPHPKIINRMVWVARAGRAREALDCEVYALHAARARSLNSKKPKFWDLIEQKITQVDLFVDTVAPKKQPAKNDDQSQPDSWLGSVVGDNW